MYVFLPMRQYVDYEALKKYDQKKQAQIIRKNIHCKAHLISLALTFTHN